jgi:hypothetical protein
MLNKPFSRDSSLKMKFLTKFFKKPSVEIEVKETFLIGTRVDLVCQKVQQEFFNTIIPKFHKLLNHYQEFNKMVLEQDQDLKISNLQGEKIVNSFGEIFYISSITDDRPLRFNFPEYQSLKNKRFLEDYSLYFGFDRNGLNKYVKSQMEKIFANELSAVFQINEERLFLAFIEIALDASKLCYKIMDEVFSISTEEMEYLIEERKKLTPSQLATSPLEISWKTPEELAKELVR